MSESGIRLRVLITNNTLAMRAGTELYVRDIALALLARGHTPIAYSTELGELAHEMRLATIPVVDDLSTIAEPPDLIHGQHHLDTMTALLHFPQVPCLYFCHGWLPWEEAPPQFPRILRYVAVDYTCRDRLIYEHAIAPDQIEVLLNFVDLERFQPRSTPLPPTPQTALVFSNTASQNTYLSLIRTACTQLGISVDVVGSGSGNVCLQPEQILGNYDLVFAKGRAALEAMAVGAAVILCDKKGMSGLITSENFAQLRRLNFGLRTFQTPFSVNGMIQEISRYCPADAAAVSAQVRATAGRAAVIDRLLELYDEVIQQHQTLPPPTPEAESRAAAAYLRFIVPRMKAVNQFQTQITQIQQALEAVQQQEQHLQAELAEARSQFQHSQTELEQTRSRLNWMQTSKFWQLRQHWMRLKRSFGLPTIE